VQAFYCCTPEKYVCAVADFVGITVFLKLNGRAQKLAFGIFWKPRFES